MINSEKFCSQAFERLVQAVCLRGLSLNDLFFGSGSDGGKETTEIEIPLLSAVKRWNGCIIVQAKCREKPAEGNEETFWLTA